MSKRFHFTQYNSVIYVINTNKLWYDCVGFYLSELDYFMTALKVYKYQEWGRVQGK